VLDRWLRDWASNNVGLTSQDRYETVIRVHLKPAIGHFSLQKLNVLLINELYAKKRAGGLQPSTIHVIHAVLDSALQAAVRWRLLAANPADAAEVPRLEKGPVKVLLPDQAQAFLQAAEGTRLYILVLLGLSTGMRLGEICALQWEDVNLGAGTVSIRGTMARTKEKKLFRKTTKTKQSTRLVELSPKVVKALKAHKTAQARERLEAGADWHDMGFVVPRPDGRPLWPQGVDRQLKALFKKASLPVFSSHVMRHTAATLMLAQGVHPKIVQDPGSAIRRSK
jgi:integrase